MFGGVNTHCCQETEGGGIGSPALYSSAGLGFGFDVSGEIQMLSNSASGSLFAQKKRKKNCLYKPKVHFQRCKLFQV